MKTTTDNHIDKLLHEAMKQRAAKVPPLADDFADKVMGSLGSLTPNSLTPRSLQEERELKRDWVPLPLEGDRGRLVLFFITFSAKSSANGGTFAARCFMASYRSLSM